MPCLTARAFVRLRRRWAWSVLVVPTAVVVLFDVAHRGGRLRQLDAWHWAAYAAAVVESLVVWGALLYGAARRTGRARWVSAALFVALFPLALGGQAYFFQQYNVYVTIEVSWFATAFADSIVNQLGADLPNLARVALLPFLSALGLVFAARRAWRPGRRTVQLAVWAAPVLLGAALFIPCEFRRFQAATPDVLYLNAVGGFLVSETGLAPTAGRVSPRSRASLPVPTLRSRPPRARNVLLILMESVRADAACADPDPDCRKTAASNRLTLDRFPLRQMRALDSATAITLAVLWTGLGPHESRDLLHTWPLVFDYARAAGYETGFWTSQNLMFGNSRLWVQNLGTTRLCSATQLDPTADIDVGASDALLAERVTHELFELREPFVAVVQFSNVHYPYLTAPDQPHPFQPETTSKAPEDNAAFFNHYLNAVHQQDRQVARILEALRNSDRGQRTVVLYTSDHGEAFREHGQMGHTFTIFDEEIRVPGWIWAPAGTLTDAERDHLASKRDALTFHVDVAPTMLDLMGVLDEPQIARYRARMLGTSLLRAARTERPLPMTNCSGCWQCGFENWGLMRDRLKVVARSGDRTWQCYDVFADPGERHDLGERGCGDLVGQAVATFGRLPGAL